MQASCTAAIENIDIKIYMHLLTSAARSTQKFVRLICSYLTLYLYKSDEISLDILSITVSSK